MDSAFPSPTSCKSSLSQRAPWCAPPFYPNPVANELHVDLPFTSAKVPTTVRLIDMNGRTVRTLAAPAQSNRIDVSDLQAGHYILTVEAGSSHKSFKVLVRH